MKTQTGAGGFTLVELLVMVAMFAMLVALGLPSLAMSRDRGQGARCLSNLRQLSTAWLAYTSDNQGKLVPNGDEGQQPSSLTANNNPQWCPGRQDLISQLSPSSSSADVGGQWIRKGLLYPYVANTAVYKCPADTFSFVIFAVQFPHVRSVSMNVYLAPIVPWVPGQAYNPNNYHKESDLIKPGPANLWVFIDENPWSMNDASFVCVPGWMVWIDCPGTLHNNSGGLAFADGHAELHRWSDPAVLTGFNNGPMGGGNGNSNPTVPPPQDGGKDLSWLQSASTYVK